MSNNVKHLPLEKPVFRHELRLDNIICEEGKPVVVTTRNISYILDNISNFRPLAINESLIKEMGFYKLDRQEFHLKQEIKYHIAFTGSIAMIFKIGSGTVGLPITAIHHLQNIWYELTGDILSIVV